MPPQFETLDAQNLKSSKGKEQPHSEFIIHPQTVPYINAVTDSKLRNLSSSNKRKPRQSSIDLSVDANSKIRNNNSLANGRTIDQMHPRDTVIEGKAEPAEVERKPFTFDNLASTTLQKHTPKLQNIKDYQAKSRDMNR